jgi:hypothetical protein
VPQTAFQYLKRLYQYSPHMQFKVRYGVTELHGVQDRPYGYYLSMQYLKETHLGNDGLQFFHNQK